MRAVTVDNLQQHATLLARDVHLTFKLRERVADQRHSVLQIDGLDQRQIVVPFFVAGN